MRILLVLTLSLTLTSTALFAADAPTTPAIPVAKPAPAPAPALTDSQKLSIQSLRVTLQEATIKRLKANLEFLTAQTEEEKVTATLKDQLAQMTPSGYGVTQGLDVVRLPAASAPPPPPAK